MTGPDTTILAFWLLSIKAAFSLLSFTLIKRLFSYSLLCASRVVSSASVQFSCSIVCDSLWPHGLQHTRLQLHIWSYGYFSWQSWFQFVLYLVWHLAWCSAYKLNKQGDIIQPCHTPFPIFVCLKKYSFSFTFENHFTNYRILNSCFFVFSQHLKLFHSTLSLFGWFLSRTGYKSYLYSFIDKCFSLIWK